MAGQFVGLPERLQGTPLTSESYVPEKSYAQQTVQHGDHRITMTKALRLGIKPVSYTHLTLPTILRV